MYRSPVGPRRVAQRSLIAAVAALATFGSVWAASATQAREAGPVARASKNVSLQETAHLHRVSKNGASFVERGVATGTYDGKLTLHLTTIPQGVKFGMTGKSGDGTLRGHGFAAIKSKGKIGTLSGRADFTGGSGRFQNAHGTGLKFSGTFNRETYAMVVTLSGGLHY
jgi:hypothetical protein